MDATSETVNFNLSGDAVPMTVPSSEERYYVEAREILKSRLAILKNRYSVVANVGQLLTALCAEAMVDSLKAEERYKLLQEELEKRVDIFEQNLAD